MNRATNVLALGLIFVATASVSAFTTLGGANSGVSCSQATQNVQRIAMSIAANANAYWAHRKNFQELRVGRYRAKPNATALANNELAHGSQSRSRIPAGLEDLNTAMATARLQRCMSGQKLEAQSREQAQTAGTENPVR